MDRPGARYDLGPRVGRGATSEVYRAIERATGRPLALKFLLPTQAAALQRFQREAELTARLDDPAIVKVYGTGDWDRRPFIAMEYIGGGSLLDADLTTDALVSVVREVARALSHAHRAGIVHRDIKPQNILLDRGGRPVVSDFGLARDLDACCTTVSVDGQVVGTPACMPPEQARGDRDAVDARSDVYALGATLYFKLVGRWPFYGDNIIDILHAVLHENPPAPRSLVPTIPRALETIVLRCLAKWPTQRYPTMCALTAALDTYSASRAGRRWQRLLRWRPTGAL